MLCPCSYRSRRSLRFLGGPSLLQPGPLCEQCSAPAILSDQYYMQQGGGRTPRVWVVGPVEPAGHGAVAVVGRDGRIIHPVHYPLEALPLL